MRKVVPSILSVIDPDAVCFLHNCKLHQTTKPGSKTYQEIVDTLANHFSTEPLTLAEKSRFHRCNQDEAESITMFAAYLLNTASLRNAPSNTLRDSGLSNGSNGIKRSHRVSSSGKSSQLLHMEFGIIWKHHTHTQTHTRTLTCAHTHINFK